MVGQGLVQIEPEKPPDTQPVSGEAHQLALRANALAEHHQLQAKEDHRVEAWPPHPGHIAVLDQLADECEIQDPVHMR
jgi:hypothetical protein